MTYSVAAKRAVRVPTSLLRQTTLTTGISSPACRGCRPFHASGKDKAVEAIEAVDSRAHPAQVAASSSLFGRSRTAPSPLRPVPGSTQLDVHRQLYRPGFYETVARIMKLRARYIEDRAVFIESRDMLPLLLGLGADPGDLAGMQTVSDRLYHDPTLPFRRSRNGRFCIDFDTRSLRRLEFQPFKLTAEEDFKRHDSGQLRRFDEVQDELQLNSVFQALFAFKALMLHGVPTTQRPKLSYDSQKWVCTLFNLRTVTTPELVGEPALEGVHSDGVDHTMTTFLSSNNMVPGSAATFMHDMAETTGIPLSDVSPHHILSRVQHKTFLDTLLIVDHERKHSLSPVCAIDESRHATRDMLVFFTRKPVEASHVSGSIDSLKPHREMPMEIPLYVPAAL
ncbi:TqaL [Drechmeria coniospora]|uniref:TqaL n=1 Tax=Drechmeria coniospora TaxID=98403 RepID=A0A151GLW5_DRECN|nr:TqaL [Drechmeria coniospora]KYK58086.1 TqaL [Drechmeria coniospora]ODA83076.1 hypothetical protein RJ55_01585 [Drechmeria coniospora]